MASGRGEKGYWQTGVRETAATKDIEALTVGSLAPLVDGNADGKYVSRMTTQ